MAAVPTFSWTSVNIINASIDQTLVAWGIPGPSAGAVPPITSIAVPIGTKSHFAAGVTGSAVLTPYGTLTQGSNVITSATGLSGLVVGQPISGFGVPSGSVISAIGASTITFAQQFNEDTNSWATSQGAITSVGGQYFNVLDSAPIGTIHVTVTPGTGVTITDENADGTGNVSQSASGAAICNLVGQAEGGFMVALASAGTFTVQCAFVTSDTNYQSETLAPALFLVAS